VLYDLWPTNYLIICIKKPHLSAIAYTSVFQPFCCSGTLHKCDDHSRNPMQWFVNLVVYIGEVEVSGYMGTNVSSGVKRQRTCGAWKQSTQKPMINQQAKYLVNLTTFDNIIWQFCFSLRQQYDIVFKQKHPTKRSPMAPKLSLDLFTFYVHEQPRGLDPQPVTLMHEAFYIFQAKCFKKWKLFNKWTNDFLTR